MEIRPVSEDDKDPWVIPLHGIETPADRQPSKPILASFDEPPADHLYADEELPTIEFRPRLRRSA